MFTAGTDAGIPHRNPQRMNVKRPGPGRQPSRGHPDRADPSDGPKRVGPCRGELTRRWCRRIPTRPETYSVGPSPRHRGQTPARSFGTADDWTDQHDGQIHVISETPYDLSEPMLRQQRRLVVDTGVRLSAPDQQLTDCRSQRTTIWLRRGSPPRGRPFPGALAAPCTTAPWARRSVSFAIAGPAGGAGSRGPGSTWPRRRLGT